ncbi:MAG: ATP-binding protein [Acidobacteriota bacterium]|nr:ATP-binding protein [Acidobacteriota bacterium]
MLTTWTWVLLIAAALLVAAGALNFAQRLTYVPPLTDGVQWTKEGNNIVAHAVAPDTAASRGGLFGILPGDKLIAISLDETHDEPVVSTSDVQIYLEEAGKGSSHLRYLIERPSAIAADPNYYYVSLDNLTHVSSRTTRDYYINFIGIVYLLVGFFVLFKQGGRAPFVLHFTTLCLVAFVFHFYKPTGSYEDLDQSIAFLDDAALILFAPLFLHFCAIYPVRRQLFEGRRRPLAALLYAPAVLLIVLTGLVYFVPSSLLDFSDDFIGLLYRFDLAHLVAALAVGAGLLTRRLWTTKSAVVRQQLKWVVWGSVLAIAPFTLLYAVGYLFGDTAADALGVTLERWLGNAALLLLVLIPLTFGNSVVRYRLMDVDIVVRRAAVYALTTLTVALMIGAVVFGVVLYGVGLYSFNGGGNFTPGIDTLRAIVAVVAMAAIVMSAAPLKNFLQERIDRIFYGERYDLRNGLLDFGRTLSATTTLDPLLNALVSRLQQVLGVERIAIFIEDARAASGYKVARAVGLTGELIVPADFREMIRTRSAEAGIVRADDLDLAMETSGFVRRALHYYVPCVVRGRMVAVIGLGRSTGGALLSSEDLHILRTVSGYVAVAIENSLLYQEQKARAAELELLKEFNESIVESINVGLLAVDPSGRVTSCNSSLEELLGVSRVEAVGCAVEDLFAEDFAETLRQILDGEGWQLTELRHRYKLHTATRAGRSLILNIALAPLRNTEHAMQAGALMVLEDVTARVRLEEQWQQREKLSSIGLLAAGVAHEINTPLTGVSSYTQMLLGMLADTDPKHALLQKINRQTERATGIVNNLLNFSRTGSVTDFSEIDVNRVLDLTLQLLEPQLRHSQIEIERDYAPALPKIYANSGKLQQVFTNLILNARDAIVDGGRITLATEVNDEDGSIIIRVSDTGIGIAPENVARIYDPFFTTKGVGRGTGLGLAVSYGIVQEHAGHISVASQPGQGTTFRISIPTTQGRTRLQVASD